MHFWPTPVALSLYNCPFMTVKALDRRTICRASSSSSGSSFLKIYAMYGIVQLGVIAKTSIIRSTTAGISTSVGSVALFGCGGPSVKGSSWTDGEWMCSKNSCWEWLLSWSLSLPNHQLLDFSVGGCGEALTPRI